MAALVVFDIIVGVHVLRIVCTAQKHFASFALIKSFLHHTDLLVQPIQKTKWHTKLSQHDIDLSSYIVILVSIIFRSSLGQFISNVNLTIAHLPVVFIATVIITLSGTCFFIAVVLIVEWMSGLFAFTKGATQPLHALISPLLTVVKIEPWISQATGVRLSLLIVAGGWLIAAFVFRYTSAWVLLY